MVAVSLVLSCLKCPLLVRSYANPATRLPGSDIGNDLNNAVLSIEAWIRKIRTLGFDVLAQD